VKNVFYLKLVICN